MDIFFSSSWHAACSWFRTCQGSRKPQRNKSGAFCNQRQLWHLTACSAQWHHVNRTSSGVSTALRVGERVTGRTQGSGVEVCDGDGDGRGKKGNDVGSDWRIRVQMRWEGGDQLRSLRTLRSRSKLFVVEERPNYHQGFLWCAQKKNLHFQIPVFTLRDVYKYSWKRKMTCLCNILLDLQSDGTAEPKTKAWVIFL